MGLMLVCHNRTSHEICSPIIKTELKTKRVRVLRRTQSLADAYQSIFLQSGCDLFDLTYIDSKVLVIR